MKNEEIWKPTKFVIKKGKLRASRNLNNVALSSRLVVDLVAQIFQENLKLHAKGKLLDLGCGFVPLYFVYKDYVSDCTCVDWENTLHKNDYLDFTCDITQSLPFGNNEFDTILLSDVLEHIPQPGNLWSEMSRILADDGKIIMTIPFFYCLHEQPNDYFRYTEFALRNFVEAVGLELIQLKPLGGAPEIMADIFAKNIRRFPIAGNFLSRFSQWATLCFVRTKFGRRISESTMSQFPLGYFLVAQKKV